MYVAGPTMIRSLTWTPALPANVGILFSGYR
jgi:hypothetical protein